MHYPELKLILSYLKRKSKCPKCRICYEDKDIFILALNKNEVLFQLQCPVCQNHILATVILGQDQNATPTFTLKQSGKNVSQNDVLDMHNFLKSFNGDFSRHFKI